MFRAKYLFPIAVLTREQANTVGIQVPEGIEVLEVRVRDKDNPIVNEDGKVRMWTKDEQEVPLTLEDCQ